MSNLFHLAIHIPKSDNISIKMRDFYKDILGGDAGLNHDDHAFAKCGNTLLAFEPRDTVDPQTLSFFATPDEMIERIQRNCELAKLGYQKDEKGKITLLDPAGNILSFERQSPNSPIKAMGMRVELGAIDLDKTKAFYQSHFDCQVQEKEDALSVNFFEHELLFSRRRKVGEGFALTDKVVKQAKETQLLVAEHFGVSDLSKERISQFIEGFEDGKGCLLTPMLANEDTKYEEIYTFVQDPNGYAVELRYLKNPNFTLEDVEKLAQQNENVVKREYVVARENRP